MSKLYIDACNEAIIDALVVEVIKGTFGNGTEREMRLGNLYKPVQDKVNRLMRGNANG